MFVLKESSRDVWLLGLVVLMSIAANLPDDFASRFSLDKRYLLLGLTMVLMFSLIRYVRAGLVLVTLVLVLGANLPAELASQFNIAQGVLTFTLIAMVALALANRIIKMPTGMEAKQVANSAYGAKALFSSVLKGNVNAVQTLIQSGVNVNCRTMSGKTPLMAAAYRGYPDIVQMLIAAGADVDMVDSAGNTAMSVGKRMGYSRVVTLLKIAGASDIVPPLKLVKDGQQPAQRQPGDQRERNAHADEIAEPVAARVHHQ
jgi:hypothetical protein